MTNKLPVTASQLKKPDLEIIHEMIRIYQEAYKNDEYIQLKHVVPEFMGPMAETIAIRVKKPECEYIIARTESSNKVVGWLALAFKLEENRELSEEHVLLAQYALLPDIVLKWKSQGINAHEMGTLAHSILKDFKDARENQLPNKHCILSTLVVDPEYQHKGVASALLAKAISLSEVFAFPIWVQTPEACQSLFERHLFEVAGEYRLDLNDLVPKPDGKGKAMAKAPAGKYVWKYMLRKEPLDHAILAYRSSKVFAEIEADNGVDDEADRGVEDKALAKVEEPAYGKRVLARIRQVFAGDDTEPALKEPLLGKGKQPASREGVVASGLAEVGPSTPLLAGSGSSVNTKSGATKKAVGEVLSS